MTTCPTCGNPSTGHLCGPCWQTELAQLAADQRDALAAGRAALRAGRPVIYVHGSPYPAPDIDIPDDPPEPSESPFPWDVWNDDPTEGPWQETDE